MKNKAGTAAGNPRARSDRASPTANGLPNTQVSSVFVYLTTAITISAAFPTPYTTSIVIILLWRAVIELCVSRSCWIFRLASAKFWVLALRSPGRAETRHSRTTSAQHGRVIPAHPALAMLITGHANATPPYLHVSHAALIAPMSNP